MSNEYSAPGARPGSLMVVFLTVFVDLLGFGIVLPLLPVYAKRFLTEGSDFQNGLTLGLLMASFSAMQFVFAPIWGRISDSIGRRPVLMIGLAGSVVFYALFGVATMVGNSAVAATAGLAMPLLFISRIGAGIAGATISTAQAYIADSTTPEKRPRGMALIGMAFGLGFTLGPLVGYFAVAGEDQPLSPAPGFAAAILSAIALAMAVFLLPESLRKGSKKAGRKIVDTAGFRAAWAIPSVMMILLALFICVFSLANFETTLSLLLHSEKGQFQFSAAMICLTYASIGLTLAIVQGGVVRRLAKRMSEGALASYGALIELVGFSLMSLAIYMGSTPVLFVALGVIVSGYSFMQPMLTSMLSRRCSPDQQGMILGVGQSVNSMARIVGAFIAPPLLALYAFLPYALGAALMAIALVTVIVAARSGNDYESENETTSASPDAAPAAENA